MIKLVPAKCPNCGANIKVDDNLKRTECKYCRTTIIVDDAIEKYQIEITGKVKVDYSDELKNLYELARRAKDSNNSANAEKYYEQILLKDPSSWEANFYTIYYQSYNCKVVDIATAAGNLCNCEKDVFKLIKDTIEDEEEQRKRIIEVKNKLVLISNMLYAAAKSHYDGIDYQIRAQYTQEYVNRVFEIKDILYNCGDQILKIFGDDYAAAWSVEVWKLGINIHGDLLKFLSDKKSNLETIKKYVQKIKKYEPEYEMPNFNTSGCYVATSVYGSYDCPQVWTLRRYRDYNLSKTFYGRIFIKTYYFISPKLVRLLGNNKWFKKVGRRKLDSLVNKLQKDGYESTPYEENKYNIK